MMQPSTRGRFRPRLFRNRAGEEVAKNFYHTESHEERDWGGLGGEAEMILFDQGDQNALKIRK